MTLKCNYNFNIKGPLSGLGQLLEIESPIKNAFYFMLETLSILEILTFSSWPFGYVEKGLDNKTIVNFNIFDLKDWTTNNYNTHNTQYLQN